MGNTVTAEKLLQEMDEKLETKSDLYRVRFYNCLNKHSILNLENTKRGRISHGGYLKEQIASCKKHTQYYKDKISLLRLDMHIEKTDKIKYKIINHYAQIFYVEVFEKMCTFEFSKNDYITEKWIKELCEHLVYLSDFYAQKSKKENSDKLPTYEDVIREDSKLIT